MLGLRTDPTETELDDSVASPAYPATVVFDVSSQAVAKKLIAKIAAISARTGSPGGTYPLPPQRGAAVVNAGQMGSQPLALATGVAAAALLALGLTILASVRQRRRELALLKALGLRARQIRAIIAWQTSTILVVAVAAGVPLGVAAGQWAWTSFANSIGVVPTPVVPGRSLLIGVVLLLLAGNLLAVRAGVAGRPDRASRHVAYRVGRYHRDVSDLAFPRFPAGFAWGVATAAYQIEGAVAEDGRGASIWDTFCRQPGAIRDGQTGDVAADHYHRWPTDVALMAELGVGAYRFSLAWPRIQPAGSGAINTAGLDFYDRLTDALLAEGITPMPTLYHWDLPQPLEDAGGWMTRDTAYRFAEYASVAAERLADRIPMWITLNEPFVVTAFGYALGIHAPGKSLMLDALATAHHQLLGHGLANSALRRGRGRAGRDHQQLLAGLARVRQPGGPRAPPPPTTHCTTGCSPTRCCSAATRTCLRSASGADGPDCVRDGDLAIISADVDALGVNYYSPTRLSALPDSPLPFQLEPIPGYPVTNFGWPVIPAA